MLYGISGDCAIEIIKKYETCFSHLRVHRETVEVSDLDPQVLVGLTENIDPTSPHFGRTYVDAGLGVLLDCKNSSRVGCPGNCFPNTEGVEWDEWYANGGGRDSGARAPEGPCPFYNGLREL